MEFTVILKVKFSCSIRPAIRNSRCVAGYVFSNCFTSVVRIECYVILHKRIWHISSSVDFINLDSVSSYPSLPYK